MSAGVPYELVTHWDPHRPLLGPGGTTTTPGGWVGANHEHTTSTHFTLLNPLKLRSTLGHLVVTVCRCAIRARNTLGPAPPAAGGRAGPGRAAHGRDAAAVQATQVGQGFRFFNICFNSF
jgi:hypothetical protein